MDQLLGRIQTYAWGSTSAIPDILRREQTGEPNAEYWLGAHPLAPSLISGKFLDDVIAHDPTLLGESSRQRFGDRLPFLMKILAADHPLSLQVHPDREQAEAGFAKENAEGVPLDSPQRTYRDDWPKPEIIIALTEFHGLCGFRDPAATVALFTGLGIAGAVSSVIGPLSKRKGSAAMAEVFLDVLSLDDDSLVATVVHAARAHLGDPGELGEFARTACELDAQFPHDRGILAALLLNRFELAPGEAMFLEPGTMHSYIRGVGVEVMASSDNVVRGGLTSKHIDVDELVQVVTFHSGPLARVETRDAGSGFRRYLTPTPEFAVWRADLTDVPARVPAPERARIVLAVDGVATLVREDGSVLDLDVGEASLLRAGEDVSASGSSTMFVSACGDEI